MASHGGEEASRGWRNHGGGGSRAPVELEEEEGCRGNFANTEKCRAADLGLK